METKEHKAHNFIDLTGKTFGLLTVLKIYGENKNRSILWECQCSCGNITIGSTSALNGGGKKSCGCLAKLPEGEGSFNVIYSNIRAKAIKRNLTFCLSKEEVRDIITRDCSYCGVKPSQCRTNSKHLHCNGHFIYNGIDRVDSTRGYEIDNVVACCSSCNTAKNILTVEDFDRWISRVYEKWARDQI